MKVRNKVYVFANITGPAFVGASSPYALGLGLAKNSKEVPNRSNVRSLDQR